MSKKKPFPNIVKEQLDTIIKNVTSDKTQILDGKRTFVRNRLLDMETMVKILLSISGGNLKKELYDLGIKVSVSAFSQRRKQLPLSIFEKIFDDFNETQTNFKTYKGYRVLAIDGTTINMFRNPNSDSFIQNNSNPKGYNQFHVNCVYDVLNKTFEHIVTQAQPRQDEIGALLFMLSWYNFQANTLIVADRGYESYNVFAHFIEKNIKFLIRVKQDRSSMREIKKLPMMELDTNISFTLTTTQRNIDKENEYIFLQTHKNKNRKYSKNTNSTRWDFGSPYHMCLRVVRIQLDTGEYETLVTNLPRDFSSKEIKELYHSRWGIETAFREFKYSIGAINLHGKSDMFVQQEIYAAMIMSNFCSRISNNINVPQKKNNTYAYKINLRMAIYLCKQFYKDKNGDGEKLIKDIAKYIEAVRPGRKDERNIKAKSFVGFTYRITA